MNHDEEEAQTGDEYDDQMSNRDTSSSSAPLPASSNSNSASVDGDEGQRAAPKVSSRGNNEQGKSNRKRPAESASVAASASKSGKPSQATAAAQKRDREKRRRGELNETLDDLSELVFEIDPSLMSGRAEVVGMQADKLVTSARKNTITNRTELIQCTVRLLTRLHTEIQQKDQIIAELRRGVARPTPTVPQPPIVVPPAKPPGDSGEAAIPPTMPTNNPNQPSAQPTDFGAGFHQAAFFAAQGLPIAGHPMGHPLLQFGAAAGVMPSQGAPPNMILSPFAGYPNPAALQQGLTANPHLFFSSGLAPSHHLVQHPSAVAQAPLDQQQQAITPHPAPSYVQSSHADSESGAILIRTTATGEVKQYPDAQDVQSSNRSHLPPPS